MIYAQDIYLELYQHYYILQSSKKEDYHTYIYCYGYKKKENEVTSDMIDSWISAEIPDPTVDPLGYVLLAEHMMHGPYGQKNWNSPCMKKGKCSKFCPKEFQENTTYTEGGFT